MEQDDGAEKFNSLKKTFKHSIPRKGLQPMPNGRFGLNRGEPFLLVPGTDYRVNGVFTYLGDDCITLPVNGNLEMS